MCGWSIRVAGRSACLYLGPIVALLWWSHGMDELPTHRCLCWVFFSKRMVSVSRSYCFESYSFASRFGLGVKAAQRFRQIAAPIPGVPTSRQASADSDDQDATN